MQQLILLTGFVIPTLFISIQIWSTKDILPNYFNNTSEITTINFITNNTDIVRDILEPQTLIPLIIGGILIGILVVIIFVFCNEERSTAVVDVVGSIKGSDDKKDIVVNLNNKIDKNKQTNNTNTTNNAMKNINKTKENVINETKKETKKENLTNLEKIEIK